MIARYFIAILPVVALVFATTGSVAGQLYHHSPNDTLFAETTINSQVTMNITQVHPGLDTLYFSWSKLSSDLPAGWQATICDNNTCYPGLMENGETLPVLPGDNGLMLIHCTISAQPGTGIIRYTISEQTTPQQVDTLTWIISVPDVAGLENFSANQPTFTVAGNCIYILSNDMPFDQLFVTDLSGKIVYITPLLTENKLLLPDQLTGVFIITLSGKSAVLRKKIRL